MKRKDPLQLFKFRFSKLSWICNFFLSLVISYYGNSSKNKKSGQFLSKTMRQIFANRFGIFSLILEPNPLEVVPDFKKAISRTPVDPKG